jgi:bacteriorhodopsin
VGSIAGDLAGAGGRASRTPVEWAFYAVGLVATVAVTVFVTRVARRALAERVPLT